MRMRMQLLRAIEQAFQHLARQIFQGQQMTQAAGRIQVPAAGRVVLGQVAQPELSPGQRHQPTTGRKVRGLATHTLSQGKLVWADGDLRAVPGAGRYIKRPPFGPNFQAVTKRTQDLAPTAVAR